MTDQIPRRTILAGAAAAGAIVLTPRTGLARPASDIPDFGEAVFVVHPDMPRLQVQARLDAIFAEMERAHFSDRRYAILFLPGQYELDVNLGFFTQVAGLGRMPGDVTINGHVHVEADWANGMALVNFWRGVENLSIAPPDGRDRWAVSQAAPYRRVHLRGDLALDDGGWSSGGFVADCRIDGVVRSGSQQQWFSRNSTIDHWQGANWNMMFLGVEGAPPTSFPEPPSTSVDITPVIREKPFLCVDARGAWTIFVPATRQFSRGTSWAQEVPKGRDIPIAACFIARPDMSAGKINAALASGRHVILTPGVYALDQPINVTRPDTVVLGLGLATLLPVAGTPALVIADVAGVTVAGILIDAGPVMSSVLMQVGPHGATGGQREAPNLLADLYFRAGGAAIGNAGTCLEINSSHVIGDNLWIWRADHGDRAGGKVHVGWNESRADFGLVVNGDDVSMHGLFVEHFRRYQTQWLGERGRTYFYQCELPYDPPSQQSYMTGAKRGWAAYKVADAVDDHHAVGLGVYANFVADPSIVLDSAIEAPRKPGVRFDSVTTISLGGGKGTIAHLVNDAGAAARPGAIRQTLTRYPEGRD